ncbi:SusC/RagA family TonB-linked outer membrane protein [Desertivirga brevis]|uniref:SusC/RagA family TonB-linked outer membrane protein n=1 Tax=Desertivirga brevis TaxID=2810310 RepID=UPI001A9722B9|nr:TonB-dependent receptor [Pedobacter sp. SYSU D00873]
MKGLLFKNAIIPFLLFFVAQVTFGQSAEIVVKGLVKDGRGESLPGVSVTVKGTTKGVVTNSQGTFTIKASSPDNILVFTFLGFDKVERRIGNDRNINVVMKEHANELNQVVIIGYGEVARKDLTGAVGQVKVEELQKAPVRSFEEALAGRIAGVQVSSPEGQPGMSSDIVIRGASSITQDNSPLYVVDGFPLESPHNNTLNPSEIESIEVLKDASASAIYGARGANGVIIITTKKGKAGKPVISYDGYYGSQQEIKRAQLMDPYEFVRYQLELDPVGKGEAYTPPGKTLESYRGVQGVDWQEQVFRGAGMNNHNLSVRGGNEQTKYSISGSVMGQDGIIINSGFKRYQGRIALDQNIRKDFRVGINANYANTRINGTTPSTYNGNSNSLSLLYSVWGYRPISASDVPLEDLIDSPMDPEVDETADYRYNPILSARNELNNNFDNSLIVNGYAQFPVFKNLTLRVTGGITRQTTRLETFYNSQTKYGDINSAQGSRGANGRLTSLEKNDFLNENILTYKRKFNRFHNLTVLGGFTMQEQKNLSFGYQASGLPNESLGLSGLEEGTAQTLNSSRTENFLMSYLGRLTYDYKSKYLFTASFRADGSSKFSPANKWSYFPSGAFAWRLSNEKFMKGFNFINNAKLRTSIGVTGNNRVSDFAYLSTVTFPISRYYTFNNAYFIGAIPTTLGNKDLRWETTLQTDAGIDLSLFKSKLNITVDYYNKRTYDLLLNAQLPSTTGYQNAFKNIGEVKNAGWEFELSTTNFNKKDFKWNTSFNISFNRNKVVELTQNQESMLTSIGWETGYSNIPPYIAKVGQPIAQFYGFKWLGNYQFNDFNQNPDGSYTLKPSVPDNGTGRDKVQPGDIKYADINGDGTVNASDRMILGNPNPDFIGGLSNNFNYKGFDLNVFFQWSYGNELLNANRLVFEGSSRLSLNQYASYADRWTPENQNNTYFRTKGFGPTAYSSRIIEDGSYLRLKTVSLGYRIPARLLKSINVSSLRVYASAQNLVTWTNYSGLDPEVSTKRAALTPGFDYAAYPRAKTIVFGLNVAL